MLKREFRGLHVIKNNHSKYIVSDDDLGYSKDGITHVNIKEFLNNINF